MTAPSTRADHEVPSSTMAQVDLSDGTPLVVTAA